MLLTDRESLVEKPRPIVKRAGPFVFVTLVGVGTVVATFLPCPGGIGHY